MAEIFDSIEQLFLNYRESGNTEFLRKLVGLVNPWLHKMIYRFTGDATITDDILQETWIVLLQHSNNFNPSKGSLGSYIYKIAKREIIHWKEKYQKHIEIYSDNMEAVTDTVSDGNGLSERVEMIRSAIMKLSQKNYQDSLILFYFAGFRMSEIAVILGTNEGNIKNWITRGRKLVTDILRKEQLNF